jgi:hypothetical protein
MAESIANQGRKEIDRLINATDNVLLTEEERLAKSLDVPLGKIRALGNLAQRQYLKVGSNRFCSLCKIKVPEILEDTIFRPFKLLPTDNPFDLCLTCHKLASKMVSSELIPFVGITAQNRKLELLDAIRKILNQNRKVR